MEDWKYELDTGQLYLEMMRSWKEEDSENTPLNQVIDNLIDIIRRYLTRNTLVSVPQDDTLPDRSKYLEEKKHEYWEDVRIRFHNKRFPAPDFFMQGGNLYEYYTSFVVEEYRNDHVYPLLMAVKLRYTEPLEINALLAYHTDRFEGDFPSFLQILLVQYGFLFTPATVQLVTEWIQANFASKTETTLGIKERTDMEPIVWLGTQKQLAELFIELKRKGFIKEIPYPTVKACFTKSDTIQQVLKPSVDRRTVEEQYEQVYTKNYKPRFASILRNTE